MKTYNLSASALYEENNEWIWTSLIESSISFLNLAISHFENFGT